MKIHQFLLLWFVLLLASADPTSASGTRVHESNTFTKRLLRTYTTEADEERGISVKIPGLETISSALKSSKTKQLEGLLKTDESIGNAFKTLGLSKMPIGRDNIVEIDKVTKLLSSPNFKVWSGYVTKLNKENPEAAMLDSLTRVFGEKNVATMILFGKGSFSSRSAAKKLESAQFDKWFQKWDNPDAVLVNALGFKRRDININIREKAIWGDFMKYYRKRVLNY